MATFKDRPVKRQVQHALFSMLKTRPIPLWLGLAGDAVEEYKKVIPNCEKLILVDRNYSSPEVEKIDVYKKFKQLYDNDQIPDGSHIDLDFCGSYETYGKILNLIVMDLRKRNIKATVSYTFSVFHRTKDDTYEKALRRIRRKLSSSATTSIFYKKGAEVGKVCLGKVMLAHSYLTRALKEVPVTVLGTRQLTYQDSPQAMISGLLQIGVKDKKDFLIISPMVEATKRPPIRATTLNKYKKAISLMPSCFTVKQLRKRMPDTAYSTVSQYIGKVLIPNGYLEKTGYGAYKRVEQPKPAPPVLEKQEVSEIPEIKVKMNEIKDTITNPELLSTFNRILDLFEEIVRK